MTWGMEEAFGISSHELALENAADPGTPAVATYATTSVSQGPTERPLGALLDPQHSAIFWIGLAAILGLVLITGQLRVETALGLGVRGGKK